MGTQSDQKNQVCFCGTVELYVTMVLVLTLLMPFVGLLDTPVTQTGQADIYYGVSKMITKFTWAMLIVVADTGVLVLTKRVLIVDMIKMFF